MKKAIIKNGILALATGCLILSASNASAWDHGRGRAWDHGRREVIVVGHDRYHYHDGRFFRPGWFGLEVAIRIPPFGAIVSFLPPQREVIIINGATYYYYDGIYYRNCPSGYVVVEKPVVVKEVVREPATTTTVITQPEAALDVAIVNVPNANGTYTEVRLTKKGNGYVGPQGEFYPGNPTVEQLRVLYAK